MLTTSAPLARVAAVALLGLLTATVSAQGRLAIEAKRIITAPGSVVEGGTLLVENGKVKAVQKDGKAPAGWVVVDRRDAVIAPGFVDVVSRASAPSDLEENADAIDLRTHAADALELDHRDFGLLRAAGVTAAVILPGDSDVVSGIACVVKSGGRDRIVAAEGPVVMNLGTSVHSRTRMPTSFMGAVAMLRENLERAQVVGLDKGGALTRFVRGRRRGLCRVPTEKSVRAFTSLQSQFEFNAALVGTVDSIRDVSLRGSGMEVVLPTLSTESTRRELILAGELERDGVDVAFRAVTPTKGAASLRLSAALAARHGLSASAALASITSIPARIAGADDRIGTLAPGRDADFVVLGGDPLTPSSRVLETWIGGARVHTAEEKGR